MTRRLPLPVIAAVGITSTVLAQSFTSDTSIDFTLTWREADSSGGTVPNPDGILEPGESALFSLTASFTNQGQTAHFAPPIGTFTSGTILGLAGGFLDINGSGGTQGSFNISTPLANSTGTSGFGVRSDWRLAGNGTVNPASDGNLQFAQFPFGPPQVLTENPIANVFRMLWTPSSFAPRTVQFTPTGAVQANNLIGAVELGVNSTSVVAVYSDTAHTSYHGVTIPIPGPSSAAVVLLGLTGGTRRRRRQGATRA
jgi:hypothetical protein